ncbi:MAG: hypothetical protein RLZZ171_587 [Cyanobacteriota bacterium]|jgi:hypothetical protein
MAAIQSLIVDFTQEEDVTQILPHFLSLRSPYKNGKLNLGNARNLWLFFLRLSDLIG